jgi:hypothetical protein
MPNTRITFGFPRTECACAECVLNCQYIPGYLIPSDLTAIAAELGFDNLLTFALEYLLASPGATVMANGEMFQIPTLVPARQANGACQFLTVTSPKRWRVVEAKAGAGVTETLPFTSRDGKRWRSIA